MAGKQQIDGEATERAIEKARTEIENIEGEDYIGNRTVFIVAQYLKGLDMSEVKAISELKPVFRQFYSRLGGLLMDESGQALSFGQAWAQLVEVWPKVKYAKGELLEQARARARGYTEPRPEIAWCDDKGIQEVVNTTYELKELRGDGRFFLSGYQPFNGFDVVLRVKPMAARAAFWLRKTITPLPSPQGIWFDTCLLDDNF